MYQIDFKNIRLKKYEIINLVWILFCILVISVGDSIPIEFASLFFKKIYYVFIYVSLPISIIWTILSVSKIKEPTAFLVVSILISVFILLIVGLASMCQISSKAVYQNANKSMGIIVQRSYGCGAWDSDCPEYKYYKSVPLTAFFNIVTEFDTTNIDKTIWTEYLEEVPSNATVEESAAYEAALKKAAESKAASEKMKK